MITTFSFQEAQSDDPREKILLPPTDPSAEVNIRCKWLGAVRIIAGFNRPPSFSPSNDVVLNDAFNVLGEVVTAIDEVERIAQQSNSI
jgi:hypothetical protein